MSYTAPVQLMTDFFTVGNITKEGVMVTVKEFVRTDAPGPAHPCDASGLSAIEFLTAVYNDPTFPMSIRIDAARALLPYTEPRPTNSFHQPILPRCKIIIPYEPSLAPRPRTDRQKITVIFPIALIKPSATVRKSPTL